MSHPTTVVGTGTAGSCTEAALSTALTAGGIVTFACGSAPVTVTVTKTLELPTTLDTVIDGGGSVTIDGGGAVRILDWNSANYRANTHKLTLQHITLRPWPRRRHHGDTLRLPCPARRATTTAPARPSRCATAC